MILVIYAGIFVVPCNCYRYYDDPVNDIYPLVLEILPSIVIILIWSLIGIGIVVWKVYGVEYEIEINQLYDGCTSSSINHKYVIKLRLGKPSPYFNKDKASLMFDLMDENNRFITRLSIPPFWYKKEVPEPHSPLIKIVKFVLNRSTLMPKLGSLRLSHDVFYPPNSTIEIHSIDIQSLSEDRLTRIPVIDSIQAIPPDAEDNFQVYKVLAPVTHRDDSDSYILGFAPFINIPEYIFFFSIFGNYTLFFCLFGPYQAVVIYNFSHAILHSLVGFTGSLILTSSQLMFYRYVIKYYNAKNRGQFPWPAIRFVYLINFLVCSSVLGACSTLIQLHNQPRHYPYWCISVLLSLIYLAILFYPVSMLIEWINTQRMAKVEMTAITSIMDPMKLSEHKQPLLLDKIKNVVAINIMKKRELITEKLKKPETVAVPHPIVKAKKKDENAKEIKKVDKPELKKRKAKEETKFHELKVKKRPKEYREFESKPVIAREFSSLEVTDKMKGKIDLEYKEKVVEKHKILPKQKEVQNVSKYHSL